MRHSAPDTEHLALLDCRRDVVERHDVRAVALAGERPDQLLSLYLYTVRSDGLNNDIFVATRPHWHREPIVKA